MIGLLQRVSRASVTIDGESIAQIDSGLCVFVGVVRGDAKPNAKRLADRVAAYRLFSDPSGRMSQSVVDIGSDILAVPQFTLAANTSRGNRAGFGTAAEPKLARTLFDEFVAQMKNQVTKVAIGRFGADMQVELINDGPVTFWIDG